MFARRFLNNHYPCVLCKLEEVISGTEALSDAKQMPIWSAGNVNFCGAVNTKIIFCAIRSLFSYPTTYAKNLTDIFWPEVLKMHIGANSAWILMSGFVRYGHILGTIRTMQLLGMWSSFSYYTYYNIKYSTYRYIYILIIIYTVYISYCNIIKPELHPYVTRFGKTLRMGSVRDSRNAHF